MKSVFGEHKQKEIPRSLQDCTKMDGVSKSLWQWAKILETIAFVLFWLNAIAGLIVGIALGADAYDDGFWLFMAGFFGGLFAGVLAYLAFFVAALLVGSLASIVENTRVSADVALFEAARAGGENVCIQKTQGATQQSIQQPIQQVAQQPPRVAVGLFTPKAGACENCNATDETLYGVMMKNGKSCQVCSKCYDYFEKKGLLK